MFTGDEIIEYSDVLLMGLGVFLIFSGGWLWGAVLLLLGFGVYWFID